MQQFSKWNKGYRYLLMIIDVFSKYGWIVPLKDKKGESVAEAFKTIFKEGRKPQYLWVDKGKEYYNKHVKDLLEKNKITLYSTENEEKSSVVERWNRTIKSKMWKQFTVQGNTIYLDMLPKILKKYNLRGYDSHFIMQEIGAIVKNHAYTNKKGEKCQMNINAIPNNMEKYMAFMLGNNLTFIDSFQFMSSSLEKLVSNLPKETFKYTSQRFKGDKFDLMI